MSRTRPPGSHSIGASMPAVEGNKKLLARWRSLSTHHSHLSPAQGGGRSWHRVLRASRVADRLPGFVGPFPPPLWIRVRAYSVGTMLAFGRKRCQAEVWRLSSPPKSLSRHANITKVADRM